MEIGVVGIVDSTSVLSLDGTIGIPHVERIDRTHGVGDVENVS
jgi:hypothetical protein